MALALELGGIHDPSTRRAFEVVSQQLPVGAGALADIPLATNFVATGATYRPQYRKDSTGMVHLSGLVTNNVAVAGNVVIGTLPVGFWPAIPSGAAATERYFIVFGNGPRTAYLWVTQAGAITISETAGVGSWRSLDQVRYLAA